MAEEYQVVFTEKPEESAWGIIGNGITSYNHAQAGDDTSQRICFIVQTPEKEIAGGAIGVVYWDWLYVDLMWIPEELRGKGYGHKLLEALEEEARKRGARHAHLDTFSFQAPEFYKKHGYREFGKLNEFPSGHTRYFLTKEL